MSLKNTFLYLPLLSLLWACNPSEEALIEKSIEMMQEEQYTEAITYLDRALLKNENSFRAHNIRGVAYFELGNYEEAIESYGNALAIDSTDYKPWYNRGNAYIRMEDYEAALINFNKALQLRPDVKDIYVNRGTVLFDLKYYEDAVKDFDFALKFDGHDPLVLFNKGKTLLVMDSLNLAIDQLKAAISSRPNYGEAFYWLGLAEITRENRSEGCLSLKRANELGYTSASRLIEQHCQ